MFNHFICSGPWTTKSGPLAVEPGVIHFEDVARQAELNFLNVWGGTVHKEFIIETTGNGAVIFDYDNDGFAGYLSAQRFHR